MGKKTEQGEKLISKLNRTLEIRCTWFLTTLKIDFYL